MICQCDTCCSERLHKHNRAASLAAVDGISVDEAHRVDERVTRALEARDCSLGDRYEAFFPYGDEAP